MAIIIIPLVQLRDRAIMSALNRHCDTAELVKILPGKSHVYRIQGDDIPKDDVVITVVVYSFDGVVPFISEVNEWYRWEKAQT